MLNKKIRINKSHERNLVMKLLISALVLVSGAAFSDIRGDAYDASVELKESVRELENEVLRLTIREDSTKKRDQLIEVYQEALSFHKDVEKGVTSKLKKKKKGGYDLDQVRENVEDLRPALRELKGSLDLDSKPSRVTETFREVVEDFRDLWDILDDESEPTPGDSSWICLAQNHRGDSFVGFGEERYDARRFALDNCYEESQACRVISCRERDEGGVIQPL